MSVALFSSSGRWVVRARPCSLFGLPSVHPDRVPLAVCSISPPSQVLVASIKLFSTLLPDVSGVSPSTGGGGGVASQVASPLFHLLADLPAVKELCAVVYLPSEAITAVPTHGQLSTLEQITMNKQFAGGDAAAGRMPRPTPPTPAFIEEIKDASAAGSRPTGAQLVSAVRDVKGLPVFDRL